MIRRQMLDDDKCHAGILRKKCQKLLKRLQTARRGTDAYHTARLDLHWNFHIINIHAHLPQTARKNSFSHERSAQKNGRLLCFYITSFSGYCLDISNCPSGNKPPWAETGRRNVYKLRIAPCCALSQSCRYKHFRAAYASLRAYTCCLRNRIQSLTRASRATSPVCVFEEL